MIGFYIFEEQFFDREEILIPNPTLLGIWKC